MVAAAGSGHAYGVLMRTGVGALALVLLLKIGFAHWRDAGRRSAPLKIRERSFGADVGNALAVESVVLEPASCTVSKLGDDFAGVYDTGMWTSDSTNGNAHMASALSYFRSFYTYSRESRSAFHRKSLSGSGSDVDEGMTGPGLVFLSDVILDYNIVTMLDIPCGDTNWQFESWETDSIGLYVGADVVKKVISKNAQRFSFHRNKRFVQWDFVSCPIPRVAVNGGTAKPFDLLHVRDVLQHISAKDGAAAAKNIKDSGAKYVISTTWDDATSNPGAEGGQAYHNNLRLAPFFFPEPIKCIRSHACHLSLFSNVCEKDLTCLYKMQQ